LRTWDRTIPRASRSRSTSSAGKPLDGIAFHPYYIVKDVLSVAVFLLVFAFVLFFAPTFGGLFLEPANFEAANPASTPEHIAPAWYFAPYYAILRAVPDQRVGAMLTLLAVLSFLFLPWLDRRRPVDALQGLAAVRGAGAVRRVVRRCWCSGRPARGNVEVVLARLCTVLYFGLLLAHAHLLALRTAHGRPGSHSLRGRPPFSAPAGTARPCPLAPRTACNAPARAGSSAAASADSWS
jgi:ubiquinol-cytochrome c reductase cytochrome b subunit